jgi:hypothetical protein
MSCNICGSHEDMTCPICKRTGKTINWCRDCLAGHLIDGPHIEVT